MAENYNDYGDYSEELVYQSKSRLGRFFSFRTLKTVLRGLFILIVVFVYGILFFRLCTGSPSKRLSKLITTKPSLDALRAGGALTVYAQEPAEHIAKDGYFGVYDVRYIAETGELQLTVRYNNSSVKKLREELTEDERERRRGVIRESFAAEGIVPTKAQVEQRLTEELEKDPIVLPEISKRPFVFILRDNFGRVYTSYQFIADEKTVYQYERLVFSDVELFGGAECAPVHEYPVPKTEMPSDIYKGVNAGVSEEITYLYLDMYYEGDVGFEKEAFAYPLLVYRSISELTEYNAEGELAENVTAGLSYKEVKETSK